MILDKLIEAVPYGGCEDALFLTPYGVKTVTSLYSEQLIKMYKPGLISEKLPTYWDLKMSPANINHQIHLNKFGLEFEEYARENIEYEYFDEKFMPPASDFMMLWEPKQQNAYPRNGTVIGFFLTHPRRTIKNPSRCSSFLMKLRRSGSEKNYDAKSDDLSWKPNHRKL